jgi:hypothetical protein
MTTKTETITPVIAKQWLALNNCNRNVKQSWVDHLANEMISGRFVETFQGIAFFEDGEVADGQHRLFAVVDSGVTIKLPVTRGVPRSMMSVVDQGAKRSVADYLHLHHGVIDANLVSAVARQIVSLCFSYQGFTLSADVIMMVIERFGDEIHMAARASKQWKPAKKAWVIAAIAFAAKSNPKEIESFANQLGTGENIKKGNPAYTLRKWLESNSAAALGKAYKRGAYESVFNVLYAASKGAQISQIKKGVQGIQHFQAKERKFIEQVRAEIKHIL